MSVRIARRKKQEVTIIDCEGSIDLGAESDPFREAMRQEVSKGRARVLLNLSGVSYVNSACVGELVSEFTAIVNSGGQLRLLHVPEHMQDVFQSTRLARFVIFDDEEKAVRSFGPPPGAQPNTRTVKAQGFRAE
jgi:anti-anti-sigma factor